MELKNAKKIRNRCLKIGIVAIAIGVTLFVLGWFIPRDFLPVLLAFVMMFWFGLPMILIGIPFLLHGLFKKFSYVIVLAAPIPLIILYIFSIARLMGD